MRNFEKLCKENYGRIFKYIYALTGNRESAEDLIQDVFTVAYEKGEAFLRHEKPPAFLYRTARNITLTYLKQQKHFVHEYLDENTPDGEADIYDKILKDQDRQIDETGYIGQVIDSLDEDQQSLYSLRYIEGRLIKDIANQQGVSEPAIRMRLVRLRREISGIVKNLKLDEK